MKKKYTIFLACSLTLALLSGCGTSAPSTDLSQAPTDSTFSTSASLDTTTSTNETISTEAASIISISGDNLTLGNLEFTIPDGFTATIVNDSSVALVSSDKDCSIGLFAADISNLNEDKAKAYLPLQHKSFVSDDGERVSESTSESLAAGFDITMNSYGEITPDLSAACMNSTFTDSWYAYTILFKCDINSQQLQDYVITFAEFTGYANYSGSDPRFDFIQ